MRSRLLSSSILDPTSRPRNPRNLSGFSVVSLSDTILHRPRLGCSWLHMISWQLYLRRALAQVGKQTPWLCASPCLALPCDLAFSMWKLCTGRHSLAARQYCRALLHPVPVVCLQHPTQYLPLLCGWKISVSWHLALLEQLYVGGFFSFDLITLPLFPVPYFIPRGLTSNGLVSLMDTLEYTSCIPAGRYLQIGNLLRKIL